MTTENNNERGDIWKLSESERILEECDNFIKMDKLHKKILAR